MTQLSDEELKQELLRQSHALYGIVGMGGFFAPLAQQYDKNRTPGYPQANTICRRYGLSENDRAGWHYVIQALGFAVPEGEELHNYFLRRREITRLLPAQTKPTP